MNLKNAKPWYLSKTLWINFIMFIGVVAQEVTGHEVLNSETQATMFTLVNILLRFFTKTEIV